jgi:hypothetical protein
MSSTTASYDSRCVTTTPEPSAWEAGDYVAGWGADMGGRLGCGVATFTVISRGSPVYLVRLQGGAYNNTMTT